MYKEGIKDYFSKLTKVISKMNINEINNFMKELKKARDNGNYIFIMGNGGSAATASHYTGDFNKGLSLGRNESMRYKMICLADNVPSVLSLANDASYDSVFEEQLKNFLSKGDLVICISGSGNSENVVKAAKYAVSRGNTVVGLTGYDGGELRNIATKSVHVPCDNMQIVEDIHMILDHLIMSIFYDELD